MESVANINGDSGCGPWPNLRTMLEFKGETDNRLCQVVMLALSAKEECVGTTAQ